MTTPITNNPGASEGAHLISGAPAIGTKNLSWRLGRKKASDPRDRLFPASKVVQAVADPRKTGIQLRTIARTSVAIPDWAKDLPHLYRHHKRGPVLDQDGWSACTWYAMGGLIAAGPIMQSLDKLAAKYGFSSTDEFLRKNYLAAQELDEWVGGEPQYYGTSMRAAAKVGQNLGFWPNYYWLNGLIELVRYVILYAPSPTAWDWFSGMFEVDKHGYLEPSGTWEGGHALLVDEASVTDRYIGGPQSWGTGTYTRWKMSFDTVEYLLSQGGEALAMPETRILLPPTTR